MLFFFSVNSNLTLINYMSKALKVYFVVKCIFSKVKSIKRKDLKMLLPKRTNLRHYIVCKTEAYESQASVKRANKPKRTKREYTK